MQWPLSWISPATVQGRDRDGRFWAFLDEAAHPGAIVTGHLVVAGDAADPVVARVLDIVERRGGAKVAMELVGDAVERWHALTAPGSSPALTEAAGGGPTPPPGGVGSAGMHLRWRAPPVSAFGHKRLIDWTRHAPDWLRASAPSRPSCGSGCDRGPGARAGRTHPRTRRRGCREHDVSARSQAVEHRMP